MNKFYVIETTNVGPNQEGSANDTTVEITKTPGHTNSSHEAKIDGWLGTTNDWNRNAHGEFDNIEAARDYIKATFGKTRIEETETDDDIAEVHELGEFPVMDREGTSDWLYQGMRDDITAETTDEELEAALTDWRARAREQEIKLHGDALDMMTTYRDGLIADAE